MEQKEFDDNLLNLVAMMRVHMRRWPTDEEVSDFIMGDEKKRLEILNRRTDATF